MKLIIFPISFKKILFNPFNSDFEKKIIINETLNWKFTTIDVSQEYPDSLKCS